MSVQAAHIHVPISKIVPIYLTALNAPAQAGSKELMEFALTLMSACLIPVPSLIPFAMTWLERIYVNAYQVRYMAYSLCFTKFISLPANLHFSKYLEFLWKIPYDTSKQFLTIFCFQQKPH